MVFQRTIVVVGPTALVVDFGNKINLKIPINLYMYFLESLLYGRMRPI